jgi:hypothetical protein
MATPIVSGAVALIEQANPFISRDKVVEYLLTGTDDVNRLNPKYIGKIGYGRLNIEQSVKKALSVSINKSDNYLLIAPIYGYESEVKVVDIDGNVKGQFFAYNPNFRGGVNVSAGDIDGDGKDEIITGAGVGGGPQVRVFDSLGEVRSQFFAYNPNFRGGVKVSCGNIDSGVRNIGEEIITSPGYGGGPHIRVFDDHADLKGEFFAYGDTYHGGVQIASGDIDNDGFSEIITGTGADNVSYVRSFNLDGKFFASFYAFPNDYQNGVNVGVIKQ